MKLLRSVCDNNDEIDNSDIRLKRCICGQNKVCRKYMRKWYSCKDSLRCGYCPLPAYNPNEEDCLSNRVRDVMFHYLVGPEVAMSRSRSFPMNASSFESTESSINYGEDSDTDNLIEYVAFHHFHPMVLQPNNVGPVQFVDANQAEEIGIKDVRTFLFSLAENELDDAFKELSIENLVGKYICAPTYPWASVVINSNKMEEAIMKQHQVQKSILSKNFEVNSSTTMTTLILNKDWDSVILRCSLFKKEASQWVTSISKKTGKILLRKLPIHFACQFNSPKKVVFALVNAYPAGVRQVDEGGKLPLHSCFYNRKRSLLDAGEFSEIIQFLIDRYPGSATVADGKGMLAIHRASSIGASDEVVNSLFRVNQRSVMMRDASGRMPKHLVRRGYEKKRIRDRLLAAKKQREEKKGRTCIDKDDVLSLKSESCCTVEASTSSNGQVVLERTSDSQSKAEDSDEWVEESSQVTKSRNEESSLDTKTRNEESSLDTESRNDVDSILRDSSSAISHEIFFDNVNCPNIDSESSQRTIVKPVIKLEHQVKLKKKLIRLNRSKRTPTNGKRHVFSTGDSHVGSFTCTSKTNRKLRKEMGEYREIHEKHADYRVDSYTCISKKSRRMKKEMRRLQRITEDALGNQTDSQPNEIGHLPNLFNHNRQMLSKKGNRSRFGRRKRSKYSEKTEVPGTIESFTSMSTRKNSKLRKEIEAMKILFEESMRNIEDDFSVNTAPPPPISKDESQYMHTPATALVDKDENDNLSIRSSSCSSSVLSTSQAEISTRLIDNYTCTSKSNNRKLKREMKKMRKLMQTELGQPTSRSKSKFKRVLLGA